MSVNISEQDILNVFLESDTDEEDFLIDENVTDQEEDFRQYLNNRDHADTDVSVDIDPWDYLDHANIYSNGFETPTEEGLKCVKRIGKKFVDLGSISSPANSDETTRGYMVRQSGFMVRQIKEASGGWGGGGPRADLMRMKTVYSSKQILELEKEFHYNHFLTGERRT